MKSHPALLVLVRHAESEYNAARGKNVYIDDPLIAETMRGVPDHRVALTPRGILQARSTGPRIRDIMGGDTPDVVYHSGYLRTVQTMQEALSYAYSAQEERMKFRQADRIRERDTGYTFGMTTQETDLHFPWFRKYFDTWGHFYTRPPGGESQSDVCDRVYTFIGELFRIRAGKKVLVFTHGGTIRAFRYNLEKWTAEEYLSHVGDASENCGITTYRFSDQTHRLELEKFAEVAWKEETLSAFA